MTQTSKDLIRQEIEKLILETKESLKEVKRFAVAEVWRILQLLTALVIQMIEKLGNDLSSPEKKELAIELITSFYDKIFSYVDIPWIPAVLEPIIHNHVKSFLMLLVGAAIDAMVSTFRDVGVLGKKEAATQESGEQNILVVDFLNALKK